VLGAFSSIAFGYATQCSRSGLRTMSAARSRSGTRVQDAGSGGYQLQRGRRSRSTMTKGELIAAIKSANRQSTARSR